MTANLEPLLQPGEMVAFRFQGRSLVRIWCQGSSHFIGCIVAAMLMSARRYQTLWDVNWLIPALAIVALALLGGVLFASEWRRQRRKPDELLITDRRILFTDSDWDDKAESMALNEVERISWSAHGEPGALDVIGRNRTIRLPVMRDADAIARAPGRAAEKSHPRPVGSMAFLNLSLSAMTVAFAAIYFGLASWFETKGLLPPAGTLVSDYKPTTWIFELLVIATAVALTGILGELPGKLLNATAMRFFATADQMEAGLCAGLTDTWRVRIALKWASLLYDRPLSYVPDGPTRVSGSKRA